MRNLSGASLVKMLALILGMVCAQSALAQSFKPVTVQGGAALGQISSGGASVWALGSNHHPYIYKKPQFVLANNVSLTQIAVGGGNVAQADTVWGLDSAGRIYHAHKNGTSWVFSRVPGVLDFIAVGIGYQDNCHPYEVWGLNPAASIFRYNFCVKNWDQVPGTLGTLAVGGGDIWGLNGDGSLFWFNFSLKGFFQEFTNCTQFAVGPTDVFALNGYVWEVLASRPLESQEVLNQVQAGGDGVWAIGLSKALYRLDPGEYGFFMVPGALVSISVGSGGGVWGLDISGKPYVFTTP
jgi:hypothetical protein